MPVRMPAAATTEVLSYGVAGVAGFAPLYLMLVPGAEEQLARQTSRWAPRWEHAATRYIAPPVQHVVRKHVTPPVARNMERVDRHVNPHIERAAQTVDRRIRSGIERAQKPLVPRKQQ